MNISNNETAWIDKQITEYLQEYDSIPPPWIIFPNTHPYDLIWRMGSGESHIMVFYTWWEKEKGNWDQERRIKYFRKWPPPPRWLTWMIDIIWDLNPVESDNPEIFDYSSYFTLVEKLGFGTQDEYVKDFEDPKWFES